MPPTNTARRARLADAAIELLAREGARGLTHRAVDAEAGEPAGTTSRYFRTRDALLRGIVERARQLHFADLNLAPVGPVEASAITTHLANLVYDVVTRSRSRHLAIAELMLESTRRPDLRAELTETRTSQIELIRGIHARAGRPLTTEQASTLVAALTGLIFMALTTPGAIGLREPSDVRSLVQAAVETVHAANPAQPTPSGDAQFDNR